ncbi:MAG: efflux RND transporter periplasmic adaptor subunit [Candidatus Brocadiae bacterium]|nr:efflux RND transporter periplasmic adaptor subunit [Candidatus Brocadiia bacterium]
MESSRADLEFREGQPLLGGLKPIFSPHAEITTHQFRGQVWFVAQDPVSLQYFRFGPTEHRVTKLLDGTHSVREIHQELQQDLAAEAPSFQDLVGFVHMLRSANLLQSPGGEKLDSLYKRMTKKRSQRTKELFSNFLFIRIPLYDPDRFLARTLGHVRALFSKWFFAVWLGVVLTGASVFFYNLRSLAGPAEGILAPDNLLLLWATFVGLKVVHEFCHAYLAKHCGAEVHRMGIIFLVFTPCAYVDVTGLWRVEDKRRRALVGAVGMMAELFIATFALFVWLATEPGVLHSVAYNTIFIASVSSVLFNGNPLLRFDAYYILSDWAELPNLWTNSRRYIRYLGKRYLLGVEEQAPSRDGREKAWFVIYGIASLLYRTMIVVGIILFVSQVFFGLGLALAVVATVLWIFVPFGQLVNYLLFASATRRHRLRCVAVFAVMMAAVVTPLALVALPQHVYAPCALMEEQRAVARARWRGFVQRVHVRDGEMVAKGQLLAECENEDLRYDVVKTEKELEIAQVRLAGFEKDNEVPAAQAARVRIHALEGKLGVLRERVAALRLTAPCDGLVIAPDIANAPGMFLKPGDPIALIAQPPFNQVVVVMDQANVTDVQQVADALAAVLFEGRAEEVECRIAKIYPEATHEVPSPGLTNAGGGPVVLDPSAKEGDRTLLPWFRIELVLPEGALPVPLGTTGQARFLIARRPLVQQWYYKLLRLLRSRYLL